MYLLHIHELSTVVPWSRNMATNSCINSHSDSTVQIDNIYEYFYYNLVFILLFLAFFILCVLVTSHQLGLLNGAVASCFRIKRRSRVLVCLISEHFIASNWHDRAESTQTSPNNARLLLWLFLLAVLKWIFRNFDKYRRQSYLTKMRIYIQGVWGLLTY